MTRFVKNFLLTIPFGLFLGLLSGWAEKFVK